MSLRDSAVTLGNCADEPIHVPGSVQPHGVLLAFDSGARLCAWSANARQHLHLVPQRGAAVDALDLPETVRDFLAGVARSAGAPDGTPSLLDTRIAGCDYDLVAHMHDGRLLAEFERREVANDDIAAFALRAHAGIDRLRRQSDLATLLRDAVEWVRDLTGFDRVMAYRFRHDDSGDVVAESVRADWPAFVGMRYPAADIPAQARRLYVLNTLRLIGDVDATPVPLLGVENARPLDLSHAVLRSVSPIHIEYLRNMGVAASMSVSIVVNGRLWGLLACHHGRPLRVPYALRMACDVFAQVLSSSVQVLESRAQAELSARAADVRSALIESMAAEDDLLAALQAHAPGLCESMGGEALVATMGGRLITYGGVPHGTAEAIVAALPEQHEGILERHRREQWPEGLRVELGRWIGLLALPFDPASRGWLLALRPEQVETVRWGGQPERSTVVGPHGHRLTPRGSFDEWREVVRDSAEPWSNGLQAAAQRLLAEMYRASSRRHAELDRLRTQLLAVLGHDLRDPLHAIKLAAQVMDRGTAPSPLGKRIQASSNRMQRLISHVLDLSRLQGGIGMQLAPRETDVAPLLRELVDETLGSHPATVLRLDAPRSLRATLDPDRFVQVAANLLSNARHHGIATQPIDVRLEPVGDMLVLEVSNGAEPLDEALAVDLFRPFKRGKTVAPGNRGGMGLGLYIAHEIVTAHGGELRYEYRDSKVVFAVRLPLVPPLASDRGDLNL